MIRGDGTWPDAGFTAYIDRLAILSFINRDTAKAPGVGRGFWLLLLIVKQITWSLQTV
jgi:hypothetical protein